MSILVAGIGNIFQGDDAFGCEVIRLLRAQVWPDNVDVIDFGIRGLDLAFALMNGPDLTILIDAVSRGGVPGTVYTIEPTLKGREDTAGVQAHAMDPVSVLRLVQTLGGTLGRILLVGCEPCDLGGAEGQMGLTETVAKAVRVAADVVAALILKEVQSKEVQEAFAV